MTPNPRILTASALALLLGAAPAISQVQTPERDASEPPSAMEQALESFALDLFGRFEPYMRGMAEEAQRSFNDYAPALENLSALMDDIGNYAMPERLPNGDIIIRRNPDAPPPPALDALPDRDRSGGFLFGFPRRAPATESPGETTDL
ncbi:MAG: hypothetical protein Q4G36_03970 [Paracoccus sp. (in: a-proteobacteria)]|nr:hypothetical protein [Paracoccus sp. (in: a-proteobacteria)]